MVQLIVLLVLLVAAADQGFGMDPNGGSSLDAGGEMDPNG